MKWVGVDQADEAAKEGFWERGKTAVKAQMISQLRDFCHLDTLAMAEIHRALIAA